MSLASGEPASIIDDSRFAPGRVPNVFEHLKKSSRLTWLGRPLAYAIGALVLTILGSGTTLLAPRLLDPTAFGTFGLLTTLFTYAGRADLGLSQLADKQIVGAAPIVANAAALQILNALWVTGALGVAIVLPILLLLTGRDAGLSTFDIIIAVSGGIMAMIANGPVTLFRAASKLWEFTALALILQLGMTLPRLAGLWFGGVTGSFAALLIYYTFCALLFARPRPDPGTKTPFIEMVRLAFPLFVFNGAWVLYLGANRWVSSTLSTPHDLGLFSLGASLVMVGIGLMSTICQVRYPKLLALMGSNIDHDSRLIEREIFGLSIFMSTISIIATMTAGKVVAFAFPAYVAATPATIALAVACLPLGVMVWMMPILMVRSHSPVSDAIRLMGLGLAALVISMTLGNWWNGIDGQAWGNAAAAFAMLCILIDLLRKTGLVSDRGFTRIICVQALALLMLFAFAKLHPVNASMTTTQPPVSTSSWKTVFNETFDTLDLQSKSAGRWLPFYPWGGRSNYGNKEQQYYVDPRADGDPARLQALQPFETTNGILSITASKIPDNLRYQSERLPYASGFLTTAGRFSFLYGSVEIRAKVPSGKGLWPAFWLLPDDKTWPPELDVFEILGDDPSTLHVTAHTALGITAKMKSKQIGQAVAVSDLSKDFHVYGLTWTKEKIVWSLDGRPVFETATPADINKPMFLVLNLAVGGTWPGSPDAKTPFPSSLLVDWIHVKQPDESSLTQRQEIAR